MMLAMWPSLILSLLSPALELPAQPMVDNLLHTQDPHDPHEASEEQEASLVPS